MKQILNLNSVNYAPHHDDINKIIPEVKQEKQINQLIKDNIMVVIGCCCYYANINGGNLHQYFWDILLYVNEKSNKYNPEKSGPANFLIMITMSALKSQFLDVKSKKYKENIQALDFQDKEFIHLAPSYNQINPPGIDFRKFKSILTQYEGQILDLYLNDLKLAEIGRELGITRQAVYYVKERIIRKIKKHVQENNLTQDFFN